MNKNEYDVRVISGKMCYPFLLKIHYARRIPSIMYSFGLFFNNELIGVVTYGAPPSPTLQVQWGKHFLLLELNRLVLSKKMEKNVLSFFVSQSLKMLPDKTVVVSYADSDFNHHGYIYQSTNWFYTGIGSKGCKRFIMKDGSERHSRHIHLINMDLVDDVLLSSGKHRYYFFVGNKRDKRVFLDVLLDLYDILPYPKGLNNYYDDSNNVLIQKDLGGYI